jgi:eukaryotic-like serine/threonine-protein kinase
MSTRTVFSHLIRTILYILVFMTAAGLGTYFTVHLMIHGANSVIVPDLMGKEVVFALEELTDLGLNTKVKGFQYSSTVPKHHIIDQKPDPGTEIKQGRDVRIVISKGPYAVVYPNVIGMDLALATILLEENDLRPGNLSYTNQLERPRGEILAQFPQPGATGVRESPVDLLVSAGPPAEWIRMPDLEGMGLETAMEAIEKYHLVVGTISQTDNPVVPDNQVVDHSPAKGYPVKAGSPVDLVIKRQTRESAGLQHHEDTLYRYRVPPGFLRQNVRVRIIRADGAMDIYNDFAKPGEEIWLLVFRDMPTALFLYLDGELAVTKHFD